MPSLQNRTLAFTVAVFFVVSSSVCLLFSDDREGELRQPLPNGPAPYFMSAWWYQKDGSIRMCASNAVLKKAWDIGGEVKFPGMQESYFYTSPRVVKASFASGKAIDDTELPKLLATQTLVVVSLNALPVDPMYRQLLRDDTIIFEIDQLPLLISVAGPKDESNPPKPSVTKR